jgi:hypothetical protein
VGLSLATAVSLARASVVDWYGILIMLCAFGLAVSKRVPIILILVLAAAAGCIVYGF